MSLFKKRCAYCHIKIEKGEEIVSEIKLPQFIEPKIKNFCSEEHQGIFLIKNRGTPSRKPYCMNCDD